MFKKNFLGKPSITLTLIFCTAFALCLLFGAFESALAAPDSFGPRPNTYDDPINGIYVSPNGNDATATGSITAPYKSINAALAATPAGGTVILRGGTYREMQNVRVNQPNITIKSAKGEWATIDLTTYNPGNQEHSAVCFRPDASGGKLQSVEVMGGYYAVCLETTWDWGPSYPTRYGASNIIIEDCKLHDSTDDTVKVKPNCKNITVRYNEIYNSGRRHTVYSDFDTGERNSEGIDNVNGDGMHVHNNYIHDICSTGIYAKGGATDVVIENNFIERAYAAGIMVGFDTSPEFFNTTVNPQYYENIRGIVRNNLIIDVGWEGIGLYASKDAQVYNNTVINAVTYGRGRYHSPIYFGVATQDWNNPTGCPPSVNPSIHHNIVIQPSTYNNRMIDIRYATGVYSFGLFALSGNPSMHENCYYVAGKSATFTDNRPGSILNNAGLTAWKNHISGESGSIEVNPALGVDYLPTNPQCFGMGYLGVSTQPPQPPINVAPAISGGQATMSLTAGYNATATTAFTITGQPAPTVTQNTTHGNRITWNNTTQRLDIANGLTAGSYPVVLTASNVAGTATFTFTLTVTSGGGGTPATTYNIADFYNKNGQLSVVKGDIIVVGVKQYKVLANTYTISYWSQNTLTAAISWWTAYMDSFAAGGVVEEIAGAPPSNVAPVISGSQATMSLSEGYGATTTAAFTITGQPAPTVTQNTTHGNRITWNNTAQRLDIANGLTAGSYPVVLTASNVAGTATFTFTLTVTSGGGGTPATTYNIADFYNKNGQLSVAKGDIIVVGAKQYKVLANTYTISYWSQNTLTAAISWWTAYMDSFAAGGVVVQI